MGVIILLNLAIMLFIFGIIYYEVIDYGKAKKVVDCKNKALAEENEGCDPWHRKFEYFYISDYRKCPDWIMYACVLLLVVSAIALFVCSAYCIIIFERLDVVYENAVFHKQVLEYRLNNVGKDEIVVNYENLYTEIREFNEKLRATKKWCDNFWIGWFYNSKVATIEYIELP